MKKENLETELESITMELCQIESLVRLAGEGAPAFADENTVPGALFQIAELLHGATKRIDDIVGELRRDVDNED